MPDTRRKIPTPQGVLEGVDVPIKEATEKWSEVMLSDGAILRIKPNVLSVTRIDGKFDNDGNPLYVLQSNQMMTVTNVPAHAKRAAVSVPAETSSQLEEENIVEVTCPQEATDVDVVVEPGALEHDKAERLSRKFKQFVGQWRQERGSMSSIDDMSMLTPYENIIGMGLDALPLIFAQLKEEGDEPDQWFWALHTISEANDLTPPEVKPEDQGNFRKMAQAWFAWAKDQGYAV